MSTPKLKFLFVFIGCHLLFGGTSSLGSELDNGVPPAYLYATNTKMCFYTTVSIANTYAERQQGFMNPPPPVGAIVFEWPQPTARNFWMNNTSIPLVLFRLDRTGNPQTLTELSPFDLTDHIDPTEGGRWAVELRRDWPTHIPLEKLFFFRFHWPTAPPKLKGKCLNLYTK